MSHRERVLGQWLWSDRAVASRGGGAFNGIGRPQVFPVLGRGNRTPVLCSDACSGSRVAFSYLGVLSMKRRTQLGALGFGHPDLLHARLVFDCWLFRQL